MTRRARGHRWSVELRARGVTALRRPTRKGQRGHMWSFELGSRGARAPRTLQRASGGIGRYCARPHRHRSLELGMD
jgi:hypothetical protein